MAVRSETRGTAQLVRRRQEIDMRHHRWHWLGVAGLGLVLLSGCGESDVASGNEEDVATLDPTDAPETGGEPEGTGDGTDSSIAQRDPAAPISVAAVYDRDAEPLLAWFTAFEPGTYRTGALGTPMSFTVGEPLNTQVNGGGMFVISDVSSRAPDDRDLVFIRVGAFSDPGAPNQPIEEQAGWPNDDFLGWLENLNEGVIATDPVETTVNGFPAIRVDLELSDDIECGWLPGSCVGLIENNGHDIKALNKGASYRVWIVEQDNEDPLAIVDGIARGTDAPWHQRADAVMDTLAFGDIAQNPVQRLVAGPNSLNALGGVEVSLPDDVAELTNGQARIIHGWTGRGFSVIPITDRPGIIYLADRPHDFDGNPLASIDEVVDELTTAGADLIEAGATTIDGVPARVFDVTTTDVWAIMLRFSPLDTALPNLGWDAPAAGRLWLIEHPDRGLMMISTHAFDKVDEVLPVVNRLGESLVETLSFTP